MPISNTGPMAKGAVIGSGTSAAASSASGGRDGTAKRTVLLYVLLAVIAIAPGLALKVAAELDADVGTWPGVMARPFVALQSVLRPISFGAGWRFWFGVVGTVLMAQPVFYWVRKKWGRGKKLRTIGGWYHAHVVAGMAGPVLVLYHAKFRQSMGADSFPANAALWSMIAVVVSGIVGALVYARVSKAFYANAPATAVERDQIIAVLQACDIGDGNHLELIERLRKFDADLRRPRQGIRTCLKARRQVGQFKTAYDGDVARHLTACEDRLGGANGELRQARNVAYDGSYHYFRYAAEDANRSLREQVWARWRLFHLPVFLVLIVATALHIYAVWDGDVFRGNARQAEAETTTFAALPPPAGQPAPMPGLNPSPASSDPIAGIIEGDAHGKPAVIPGKTAIPRAVAKPQSARRSSAPSVMPSRNVPSMESSPVLVLRPALAIRPAKAPVVTAPEPASEPAAVEQPGPLPTELQKTVIVEPATTFVEPLKTVAVVPPPPVRPVVAETQPPATEADAPEFKDLGTTITRKLDLQVASAAPAAPAASAASVTPPEPPKPPMGLGAPRTLVEQIATYKANHFAHSELETGFALTGKHTRADCASCHHDKPLLDSRPAKVRACIACHRSDDAHNGRRPNCANCHVPTRWSQIKR